MYVYTHESGDEKCGCQMCSGPLRGMDIHCDGRFLVCRVRLSFFLLIFYLVRGIENWRSIFHGRKFLMWHSQKNRQVDDQTAFILFFYFVLLDLMDISFFLSDTFNHDGQLTFTIKILLIHVRQNFRADYRDCTNC
jgi:hypothetical protein